MHRGHFEPRGSREEGAPKKWKTRPFSAAVMPVTGPKAVKASAALYAVALGIRRPPQVSGPSSSGLLLSAPRVLRKSTSRLWKDDLLFPVRPGWARVARPSIHIGPTLRPSASARPAVTMGYTYRLYLPRARAHGSRLFDAAIFHGRHRCRWAKRPTRVFYVRERPYSRRTVYMSTRQPL